MPPEQTQQSTPQQSEKKVFFRVTPFSKYLAMALFIVLPFIGGWIGYQYAPQEIVEKIVLRKVSKEASQTDVTCYQNADFFVIAPLYGDSRPYIVKEKEYYSEVIPCSYELNEADREIDKPEPQDIITLENNKLIIDSGTSKRRGLGIYDLAKQEIVFKTSYFGHDFKIQDGTISYWTPYDDGVNIEKCSDYTIEGIEGSQPAGINHYVQLDIVTLETTILDEECGFRE